MLPVAAPKQLTFVLMFDAVNSAGSVTIISLVAVQAFASVTVTMYVPAESVLIVTLVLPLLQR
jgi:hypothetical protein